MDPRLFLLPMIYSERRERLDGRSFSPNPDVPRASSLLIAVSGHVFLRPATSVPMKGDWSHVAATCEQEGMREERESE